MSKRKSQCKKTYELQDFLDDCVKGTKKVMVSVKAMETAKNDFNLGTQQRVLDFINAGGLEYPYFINSEIWINNSNKSINIMVDAYSFYSDTTQGYIAFLKTLTDQWLIKSFKKNKKRN